MACRAWVTRPYGRTTCVPTESGWMIRVMADGDAATCTSGRMPCAPTAERGGAGWPAMPMSVGSPVACPTFVHVAGRTGPGRHSPVGRAVDLDTLVVGTLLAAPWSLTTTGHLAHWGLAPVADHPGHPPHLLSRARAPGHAMRHGVPCRAQTSSGRIASGRGGFGAGGGRCPLAAGSVPFVAGRAGGAVRGAGGAARRTIPSEAS